MNEVIAINIRICREKRAWTQEHLAAAACTSARTIQRAEGGRGMTAETLTAIAGALDVSVDDLRRDVVAEFAAEVGVRREDLTPDAIERHTHAREEQFHKEHMVVPVARVMNLDDIARLDNAHGVQFAVLELEESIRDTAAELEQQLIDYVDVARDLEPLDRHRERKRALELVQKLEGLGCRVAIGADALQVTHVGALGSSRVVASFRSTTRASASSLFRSGAPLGQCRLDGAMPIQLLVRPVGVGVAPQVDDVVVRVHVIRRSPM